MNAMTVKTWNSVLLVGGLISFLPLNSRAASPVTAPPLPLPETRYETMWAHTPLLFEANQGQTDAQVRYLTRGKSYTLFLTANEAVFQGAPAKGGHLRARLLGANPAASLQGLAAADTRVNYFRGQNAQNWQVNVPTFHQVKCAQVYPGVDLIYYGKQGELEFDFVVAPGANPRRIAFAFKGAQQIEVDPQGDLVLKIQGGEIRHRRPYLYQEIEGTRREIRGRYKLNPPSPASLQSVASETSVTFDIGAYDSQHTLIIDPVLSFATYLGGAGDDQAFGIAVDSAGAVYLTGQTASPDFPTESALQANHHGAYDVFLTKFDPSLSKIVYSTMFGGNGVDRGFHLAVDQVGNAVVVGVTSSTNLPTYRAFQPKYGGGERDGFMAKISASGSALIFATYLGGNQIDDAACVAVDRQGNAYVGGDTSSTNFPILRPIQSVNRGNPYNVVIGKFGPDGALRYLTYLGGSGQYESAIGIAVDAEGSAYLTGYTSSSDFPVLRPVQSFRGEYDAFIVKLNPTGSALLYSSYLGGSAVDVGRSIAVDQSGNAYVSGDTFSTNFPIHKALQSENRGRRDVFVTKMNPAGNALLYSTYLGGNGEELAVLTVDANSGSVYLAGLTSSPNFPTENAVQTTLGGGTWDAFTAKLDPQGANLIYSTFLGGSDNDQGAAIAIDRQGQAYIAGSTASTNFPTVKATQTGNHGGSYDAFLVKLSEREPRAEPAVTKTPEPTVPTTPKTNEVAVSPTPAPPTQETPTAPAQAPITTPDTTRQTPASTITNLAITEPTLVKPPVVPLSQTNLTATTEPPTKEPETTPSTSSTTSSQPPPAAPPETQATAPTVTDIVKPSVTPAETPVVAPDQLKNALLNTNLIINGDAESGPAARSSYIQATLPGWTLDNKIATNKLTVLRYGMPGGFPGTNDPGPVERGGNLFVGGPDSAQSLVSQVVDVSALASEIDANQIQCQLKGYLGGVGGQHDNPQVQIHFKSDQNESLGKAVIGPVTLANREYKTALLERTTSGKVPAGTRKIEVQLIMTRVNGTYNDALADNLSLMLVTR